MKSIAATVAENKKKYPHLYCQGSPGCLWRIHTTRGDSPCPRHPVQPTVRPANKEAS